MSAEENHIDATIPKLSPRARTAFAIGCVERVLPMAEWYFGPKRRPAFQKAIEQCWSFALGQAVNEEEVEASEEHFDALMDKLYEDDEDGSPYLFVAEALLCALASISQPEEPGTVKRSVGSSRGAACAEDAHKFHDVHMQEEAEWQALAVDVALAKTEPTRDMFAHLPTNPNWLQGFRARKPPRGD